MCSSDLFWQGRWDGSVESLTCQSRRPHSHPNQHTEAELKLIRDMRRRNPTLGMVELWHRLRQRGYTRRPESLFRVMRKLGLFPGEKPKKAYTPKPYEQMTYPGQRVQVDVKVVPRRCITDPELRLFQYTAIDEFTRLRFLAAYQEQSTYSSADFLKKLVKWYARRGIQVECVQTDNGFEFPTAFPTVNGICLRCLSRQRRNLAFATSSSDLIPHGIMVRLSAATVRTKSAFILVTVFIPLQTLKSSLLSITAVPTTFL